MVKVGQDSFPTVDKGQTCIICGSAPSLLKDYEEARINRPTATIIAVNEAAHGVYADHLVTLHYDRVPYFINPSINQSITVHVGKTPHVNQDRIDYVWRDVNTGGTSGTCAMLIAHHMGYDEIILCGMPLEPTGYYNDGKTVPSKDGSPRFGYMTKDPMLDAHRRGFLKALSDYPKIKETTRSLFGWTQQILGEPQWRQI